MPDSVADPSLHQELARLREITLRQEALLEKDLTILKGVSRLLHEGTTIWQRTARFLQQAHMQAFGPLFALCLFYDVFSYVAVNALASTGGLGSSQALLHFHHYASALWALRILASSIIEGCCILVPSPLFLLTFAFRALNILVLLNFDGVAAMSGVVFIQGLTFGITLVQGILSLTCLSRGWTSIWSVIVPTCIIVGVFLPPLIIRTVNESDPEERPLSIIIMILNMLQIAGVAYTYGVGISRHCVVPDFNSTGANGPHAEHTAESIKSSHDELPTMRSPEGSTHGKFPLSHATVDAWGVMVGFMQISCLVPILSGTAESQKAFTSTESWVFVFVVATPVALLLFVKNDFDVYNLAILGNMLSNLTVTAFLCVNDSVCWSHLGFWLVICSTLAFYFDSVREMIKEMTRQPSSDCSCQLVLFLAVLATRVAMGCLAGSAMRALIENLLPLASGIDEIGFKACSAMLPGAFFAMVVGFRNVYIGVRDML